MCLEFKAPNCTLLGSPTKESQGAKHGWKTCLYRGPTRLSSTLTMPFVFKNGKWYLYLQVDNNIRQHNKGESAILRSMIIYTRGKCLNCYQFYYKRFTTWHDNEGDWCYFSQILKKCTNFFFMISDISVCDNYVVKFMVFLASLN